MTVPCDDPFLKRQGVPSPEAMAAAELLSFSRSPGS